MDRTTARRRFFRFAWVFAGLAAMGAAGVLAACTPNVSDASLTPMERAELADRLERNPNNVLLVDTRSPTDFRRGTIPGAVNLTLRDVPHDVDTERFERYGVVVVFGEDPGSATARAVAKRLLRRGVDNVYLYEGGVAAWPRLTASGVE
jgi:rhodanese-related sulfurtransferase